MTTKDKIKKIFYDLTPLEIELLQEAIQNRLYIYSTEIKTMQSIRFNPISGLGKTMQAGSQSYDLSNEDEFDKFVKDYTEECQKHHSLLSKTADKLKPLFELVSEIEHDELKSKFD